MLGIPKESQIASCMAIGYTDVTYKRTEARKKANIEWM